MNKTLSIFSLVLTTIAHLLCCGLPILMNLMGGSIGFLMILQPFTPILTLIQGGILGWSFHRIYGVKCQNQSSLLIDKVILWAIVLVTFTAVILSHTDLLKTEEEKLKQRQIELFFKKHQQK